MHFVLLTFLSLISSPGRVVGLEQGLTELLNIPNSARVVNLKFPRPGAWTLKVPLLVWLRVCDRSAGEVGPEVELMLMLFIRPGQLQRPPHSQGHRSQQSGLPGRLLQRTCFRVQPNQREAHKR